MSSWLDGEQAVNRRKAEAQAYANQVALRPDEGARRSWRFWLRRFRPQGRPQPDGERDVRAAGQPAHELRA
jgi:hypothetical protein